MNNLAQAKFPPGGKIDIGFMWNGPDEQLRWLAQAGVSDVVGHVAP
jgi:hypothetical protein